MAIIGDQLHLDALEAHKNGQASYSMYGTSRGDPLYDRTLWHFLLKYVLPHVRSDRVACEIGSGGGRITQFLTGFKQVYAVDYFEEMHSEMRRFLPHEYIIPVVTNGTDFPDMGLVDYVVAFDTFTYFEPGAFSEYLTKLGGYLNPGAEVIIQYASKRKRQSRKGIVSYEPSEARRIASRAGYVVRAEDSNLFKFSNILRLNYHNETAE